nr:hypothetical protein [uncultured organism]
MMPLIWRSGWWLEHVVKDLESSKRTWVIHLDGEDNSNQVVESRAFN